MPTRILDRWSLFVVAWIIWMAPGLGAQTPGTYVPPGYVLVDDMILPWEVVYADSTFDGTPWPNGTVPYVFDAGVSAANQARALTAMAEWEAVADVDFVPRTAEADYLYIQNGGGANNSLVGMAGGAQTVNITSWNSKYIIVHELCHALGFLHEQCRPDRDLFVQINWQNISQTACSGNPCNHNFFINNGAVTYGAYDFLSIMHYGGTAFTTNGQQTITVLAPNQAFQNQIGNRAWMTALDANGMATRYGAPAAPTITSITPPAMIAGSGPLTLTVSGTQFFEGSADANGVQGSRVQWNGADLPTTYVNPTRLTATVAANLVAGQDCGAVRVRNAAPGGGFSNSVNVAITPAAAVAGTWWGLPGERLGSAVAGIGDVNGDGRDDVCVGLPGHNQGGGQTRAFSGADGSLLWISPGNAASRSGSAVAAAGDVDGDGIGDVLVGSPGYLADKGLVELLSGVDGIAIWSNTGGSAGDEFGFAVASAGDVDGDGTPDVIVGSPGRASDAGRVEVLSGATNNVLRTFNGDAAGDRFGEAVGGGQDLGGDGVPDIAVGAPGDDNNGDGSGMLRVYGGATGTALLTRNGDGIQDYLGRSVAVVASVDGDARGDVIAGAPESGDMFGGNAGPGYARVFSGWNGAAYATLFTFTGSAARDGFGRAVAAAGDVDQDGHMDLAVGAPQPPGLFTASNGPGAVRILSGKDGTILRTVNGGVTGEWFGWALAAAGDVDADGALDLVAGAPEADVQCTDSGQARVIHPRVPPEQRKVMITEVSWGDPDGLEITNFSASSVDLAGWKVRWDDGPPQLSNALAATIAAGESVVITETSAAVLAEMPAGTQRLQPFPAAIPTTSSDLTVALINAAGIVVDEVRISSTTGIHVEGGTSGSFRGLAVRGLVSGTAGAVGVERLWGLDSNGGGDWTEQPDRSFGLENRSSGPRGTDPVPVSVVRINEIDANPDLVEFRNMGGAIDVQGWFLLCSAGQGVAHRVIRPWAAPTLIAGAAYFVVGEGAAPAELPPGVSWQDVVGLGFNFPWTSEELDCALYDHHGRLVDLMRTTGHDDQRVHNHPRAPSHWADFGGAAARSSAAAEDVLGRSAADDSNTGADWSAVQTRTMGFQNAGFTGSAGFGDRLDVRLNETGRGDGIGLVINAGPAYAGSKWSFFATSQRTGGQGPFFGLALHAADNWLWMSMTPPWFGFLDARGSARLDVPPGSLPGGIGTDDLFILQDSGGGLQLYTKVLEWDT